MKRVQIANRREVIVQEVPEPQVRYGDDVKIKVHYVSICADDLYQYNLGSRNEYADDGISHEFSGEIVALGESAAESGFSVGDRVSGYCWLFCGKCPFCKRGMENMCLNSTQFIGAMAEYIIIKDKALCVLPDCTSYLEGSMTELVAASLHGIERTGLRAGNSCLILGGGGAGQVLLQTAKLHGATRLTLADPSALKRALARKTGADFTIDPESENIYERTMEISDYLGFDIIVEATGNKDALDDILGLLSRGGTVLLFSLHQAVDTNFSLSMKEAYYKEASVKTSYMAPFLLPQAVELLPRLHLEALVGRIFSLDEAPRAFELCEQRIYPRIAVKICD